MTGPPTRRDWRDQLAELPVPQRLQLLRAHSGLPGPRANLTLLDAAADLADPAFVAALLAADDEYLTSCGAAGLGTLAAAGGADPQWPARLHQLARDERWRVREGVAMALQRLGDADRADGGRRLAELTDAWSAEPDPLVQRAVVAGLCEPRLLRAPAEAARAIELCRRATDLLVRQDPATRRHPGLAHPASGPGLLLERGRRRRSGGRAAGLRAARPVDRRPRCGLDRPDQRKQATTGETAGLSTVRDAPSRVSATDARHPGLPSSVGCARNSCPADSSPTRRSDRVPTTSRRLAAFG